MKVRCTDCYHYNPNQACFRGKLVHCSAHARKCAAFEPHSYLTGLLPGVLVQIRGIHLHTLVIPSHGAVVTADDKPVEFATSEGPHERPRARVEMDYRTPGVH